MKPEEIKPTITVGGLTLVGNYWFQMKEGQEAAIEIPPLRFIFLLEDFNGDGDPESEVLPSDDPRVSRIVFRNMKKIGSMSQYATTYPGSMAQMGGKTLFISYSLRLHLESMFISLAIYAKEKESDNAG